MKDLILRDTKQVIEFLNGLNGGDIVDGHHWIGDHSIRLDGGSVKTFITDKLIKEKHLVAIHYTDNKRICVELGLSGRNTLYIDLW